MLCYRDMTFCSGDGCQNFDTCHRALTEHVKKSAEKSGLMIAQFGDPSQLDCYKATEESPTTETP